MLNRFVSFTLVLAAVSAADAGFWENAYRGLDILATPLGGPLVTTSDGTRVNGARSGRLRIVPSGVGGPGYQLEFDRTFGPDSKGRPETLHLGGVADLTLSGPTQMTLGYNKGPRDFLTGRAEVLANELNYSFRSKTGPQDVQLFGTLSVSNALEINNLGFYTLAVDVSNSNSQLIVDGVVVRNSVDGDFDIGPINIQGNILVDALASLLSAVGVETEQLERLFPESPISQINNAIAAAMADTTTVAGTTVENEFAPLLVSSILHQDSAAADALLTGLADGSIGNSLADQPAVTQTVPEPGTLLLLLCGSIAAGRRRAH